ncbi:MAG: hypothetical protein RI900_2624 [Actinomycetota bacterium]|jgi:uncharacterized membrane protein
MSTHTVLARRPDDTSMRRLRFSEHVSPSLWFVPVLFVVGALALSRLTLLIDHEHGAFTQPQWLVIDDPDAAGLFAGTVAAAMLSFVAMVFSTTFIAIQLAGAQYSPRVVRVFVRSRLTHVTLGLFLATFVIAMTALLDIRGREPEKVPVLTVAVVVVLLLVTLGVFVVFVHGMSMVLRIQYLSARITRDGRRSLLQMYGDAPTLQATMPDRDRKVLVRHTSPSGVVQAYSRNGLVELAARHDVTIELLVDTGLYVGTGTPLAVVQTSGSIPTAEEIVGQFALGHERTMHQDPRFALRQLVDIAIRALSPAVNDPTTAAQTVDRITDLVATVVHLPDPVVWYADASGVARLQCGRADLERLLLLSYSEVIRYGADAPQVIRRLRSAFDLLEPIARPDVVPVVGDLRRLLDRAAADALPSAFTALSADADAEGLG